MTDNTDWQALFDELKSILAPYSRHLDVVEDSGESYHLDTRHVMKNGKPLFFGAAKINKRYVSFHLMPVYVNPSLLDSISASLRKRMQGKSCFNFVSSDQTLLAELRALTESAYRDYVRQGYIEGSA